MFKKFNPKEDVSGSTSLKSSVQRNIRSSLLTQLPFLSLPAYRSSNTATSTPAPPSDPPADTLSAAVEGQDGDEEGLKEESSGKKKGGKGKGGKGKKGKGKEEKEVKTAQEEEGEEEGEMTVLNEIWPKKEPLGLTKCHERISMYTINGTPMWWNHFDGPFIPTLKLLHRYPAMLPHVQIDRGAIKFLLAGANMMAPGLLSPGGRLPPDLAKETIVAIHAEGKEHACGIGKLVASSEEIRKTGKGVAIEVLCWIGDDLWKIDTIA